MGYSCTLSALRTLQVVKNMFGKDLEPDNEFRTASGRLVFFERGAEREDGAIVGTVSDLQGGSVGRFHINPNGTIKHFAGLTKAQRGAVVYHARCGDLRGEWRAVI